MYEQIASRDADNRARQVEDVNNRYNEQLKRLTPENADSTILELGTPSPQMLAVGMPDKPLRLYGNKLLAKAAKHGYNASDVRNLPQAIENPIAIFKGRYNGSYAILTELDIDGNNVLASIDVNKGAELNVNILTSVYGKEKDRIVNWIEADRLLYADKTKALDYLIPPAPVAGDPSNSGLSDDANSNIVASAAKIVTDFENPKIAPENIRQSTASDNRARFLKTPSGEVYGFTVNGKIYLDSTHMNANTPVHEYAELWWQIVRDENPELIKKGAELMRQTKVGEEVNADPNYRTLSEDARDSETFSRIVADIFEKKFDDITDKSTLLGKLKSWIRKFWKGLKSTFGKWSEKDINELTVDKFTGMPLRDLAEGVDLAKYRKAAADERTLAGVHNLSEKNLAHAAKMGGLANPSVGVINTDRTEFGNFGEISLIAPSDLINKTTGRNVGTWAADAYTPRYPVSSVVYIIPDESRAKIEKQFTDTGIPEGARKVISSIENSGKGYMEEDAGLMYMFLRNKGIDIAKRNVATYDEPTRQQFVELFDTTGRFSPETLTDEQKRFLTDAYLERRRAEGADVDSDKYKARVMADNGEYLQDGYLRNAYGDLFADVRDADKISYFDTGEAARKYIEENDLAGEYTEYVDNLYDSLGVEEKLFDGYTPSGNRRYLPHTLENISRMMRERGRASGENFSGMGAVRATLTPIFKSLEDMRKGKGRIVSHEEFERAENELSEEFDRLTKLTSIERFDDAAEDRLVEAMLNKNPKKYLKDAYDIAISEEDGKQIKELAYKLSLMPTEYFETKFERPVKLDEFVGAVIPENASPRTRKILEDAGIPYRTYKDESARPEVIRRFTNELNGVRFMGQPFSRDEMRAIEAERAEIVERTKADGTYLKAPNGKDTKLTPEQWVDVRTSRFKEWFGDWERNPQSSSKVVDENGEPKIVQHWTPNEFTSFDIGRLGSNSGDDGVYGQGFYFGDTRGSSIYGDKAVSAFLNLRNPIYIPESTYGDRYRDTIIKMFDKPELGNLIVHNSVSGKNYSINEYIGAVNDIRSQIASGALDSLINEESIGYGDKAVDVVFSHELARRGMYETGIENLIFDIGREAFTVALKNGGYDGVISDAQNREYIAFYPSQIKSATENVGTYRADYDDIRFNIARNDADFESSMRKHREDFDELAAEYDKLLQNKENIPNFDEALNDWRDRKVGAVRNLYDDIAEQYGFADDAEIIVYNGEQDWEAVKRLVLASNPLITEEQWYNLSKEEIKRFRDIFRDGNGFQIQGTNTVAFDVSAANSDGMSFSKLNEDIIHEQTHSIINKLYSNDGRRIEEGAGRDQEKNRRGLSRRRTGRGDLETLRSIYAAAREYPVWQRKLARYAGKSAEIQGGEGLAYAVSELASSRKNYAFQRFMAGEITAEEAVATLKNRIPEVDNAVTGILETFKNGADVKRTQQEIISDRATIDGIKTAAANLNRYYADMEAETGEPATVKSLRERIAELYTEVRTNKAETRDIAHEIADEVRRQLAPQLVEAMGKRDFDNIVRVIENATAKHDIEEPLKRLSEIVADIEIKSLQASPMHCSL